MPRRVLQGVVVSDKGDKTISVRVERRVKHPLYGKIIKQFKKYAVHDPLNSYKIGEFVQIIESKPYSKMKCWEVFSNLKTEEA